MATATKQKLSPAQERVITALEAADCDPVKAAKRLKISPNGVYGHLRRIEEKGHDVSRYRSDSSPAARTRRRTPRKKAAIVPVEAHVKNAIRAGEHRLEQIEREKEANQGAIDSLVAANSRLSKERVGIKAKVEKLEKLA